MCLVCPGALACCWLHRPSRIQMSRHSSICTTFPDFLLKKLLPASKIDTCPSSHFTSFMSQRERLRSGNQSHLVPVSAFKKVQASEGSSLYLFPFEATIPALYELFPISFNVFQCLNKLLGDVRWKSSAYESKSQCVPGTTGGFPAPHLPFCSCEFKSNPLVFQTNLSNCISVQQECNQCNF